MPLLRALISLEAPSPVAAALQGLLGDRVRVAPASGGDEAPACALVAHAPPEADALVWLAADDRSTAVVVVTVGGVDPSLRRAALRAGAMEVVALEGLTSDGLLDAIEDARARRLSARRASRPPGHVDRVTLADRERRMLLELVEHSGDFVAAADLDGRLTYMNPGGRRMVGVGPDDDVGATPFARYLAEGSREFFRTTVAEAVRDRGIWEGEIQLVNVASGCLVEAFCSTFLLRDPDTDAPWCYATVTRDITAQKRVAHELTLANGRLRAVLTANDVGIWFWDPLRDELVGDRNLVRLFEFDTLDDTVSLAPYLARIHPGDRPRVEASIARVVAEGGAYDEVYRVMLLAGGVRWLHARGLVELGANARPTTFPGIALDVTRSIETTERLRESDERYRALLESIDDGFCIIEVFFDAADERAVDYRFIELNASFARQTGLVDAEGKTARSLVPELDEFWYETYGRVARTGETARFERHEPAMGRWFEVEAMRVGAPELRRVALLFRDATERRASVEALREADRRKDDFIAILAHELRNPLAPVRNAVQILKLLGPTDARVTRARDVIDRQVTHMARLIDDLLDVSRIARGKLALQREVCDLAAIARQTADDYRANLESEGLTLAFTGSGQPAWVEGDPVRLAQMIANLLHNAGRFTPRGGRVEVCVDVERASERAALRVIDTGVGIEPELLARLFDPFSQAQQDIARSKGGLGLGLALTRGLAGLHGGDVEAQSDGPGRGATFTLHIPLARPRYEAAEAPQPRAPRRPGVGVLVVEDNRDAAETLRDLLVLLGYTVEVAFDGAAALEVARSFRPDAVVSDLGLPGELDGYAVARALRSDPSFEGVRLIALSGYANDEARRRSREAGFDVHLAKPPDLDALERELAVVRDRRSALPA